MSLVQESLARSSLEEVHGVVHLAEAIAKCNERFSRLVGFDAAALVGKSLLELCPELQADGAFSAERWKRRWQAARAGLPQWFPWQFRNRQGRRVHALINLSLDPDDPGRVVANVHDLSNLGQSGWIRPDSRARLQQVLDHTKAIIIVKDLAGRYVFANREFERATRMAAERVIGYSDNELWPPEHVAQFVSHDTEVFATRTATEYELTATIARQRKTFLAWKFPLFKSDGEPYAICGVATDITDRKRTQDALTKAALAVSSAEGATVFQELVRYLATILEVDAAFIAVPSPDDAARSMQSNAFFFDGEIRENFTYVLAGTPCETVVDRTFRIYPSGVHAGVSGWIDPTSLGLGKLCRISAARLDRQIAGADVGHFPCANDERRVHRIDHEDLRGARSRGARTADARKRRFATPKRAIARSSSRARTPYSSTTGTPARSST